MMEPMIQGDQGLSSEQAQQRWLEYGPNEWSTQKKEGFYWRILHIIREPMFLLLIAAGGIYFALGEPGDGAVMLVFVLAMISIEVIQEWKTDQTLSALKALSAPQITVVRDGNEVLISSTRLVPGDLMVLTEGARIPADGAILRCNDLCVDESSLTGESERVWKIASKLGIPPDKGWRKDYCYAGTVVIQGSAHILVDKTGQSTEYGRIGRHIQSAPDRPSPLQQETARIVKIWAAIAAVLFLGVAIITFQSLADYALGDRLIKAVLSGITLAMATIPEEFPVILTVFLSMGAWRLAKKQSLVRKLSAVETLGGVSVLCVDKTGTITMNRMSVAQAWAVDDDQEQLIHTMGLACETDPYDPMEKAMLEYAEQSGISKRHLFGGVLISEYSFTNQLKMMGHIWNHDDQIILAAKGSPESILQLCEMSADQKRQAERRTAEMSQNGWRVIAVGVGYLKSKQEIPAEMTDCSLRLCGLVGLIDPPRESIHQDIAQCLSAGIRVVMITGDHGLTASAIAAQIGMPGDGQMLTGDEINAMSDEAVDQCIQHIHIFSRVTPEHKMRIVKAFQRTGEIVAMTGDGVNDAPALKHADIGITMGQSGSDVSCEAADLILLNDNFSTIVDTIRDGRRIYDNIRKAVGYVFTIHIPIILAALLAPLLGIFPAHLLLLPVHVVLLELLIDPTCSVVLERQPAERNIMSRSPRGTKRKLLTWNLVLRSVIQGVFIFITSFGSYFWFLKQYPAHPFLARSMGLSVIMLANIFLVQALSSDVDSIIRSMRKTMRDKVMWMVTVATVLALLIILYTPVNSFLRLAPLTLGQLLGAFGLAALSVLWIEVWKMVKRLRIKASLKKRKE